MGAEDDIDTALNQWNINTPLGTLYGPRIEYNIYANGQLMNAEEYRHLTVAYLGGRPVYLQDVARVIDSVQDDKQASWLYTKDERTGKS